MGNDLGTDKDVYALARKARKQGFKVEVTGGNHVRWTAPDGAFLIQPMTYGKRVRLEKIRKWLNAHGAQGF